MTFSPINFYACPGVTSITLFLNQVNIKPIKPHTFCAQLKKMRIQYFFKFHNFRPQRGCEGYVFTPVCPSTGGSASVHAGIPPSPPQGADTLPPGVDPAADGYCCGQYASYGNAFLF